MKNEKVRQYFLAHQIDEISDIELKNKLDNLVLYQNGFFDLKSFMNKLEKIINWGKVNYIQAKIQSDQLPENYQYILDIHTWAKRTFFESLQNGNSEKLIISYMLGDFLFLEPADDYQWDTQMDKIQENLNVLLPKVKVNISVPENAPYSEKKYYRDYQESFDGTSYRKVFDFLFAIDHGRGVDHNFSEFFKAITIICFKINPKLLNDNIGKYSPVLIKMLFKALNQHQTVKLLNEYNDKPVFPLLIGLVHAINQTWNNQYDNSLETDYDYINSAAIIVSKISERMDESDLYKLITDCSNISGNKLWQSIYIAFAVRNQKYLESYLSNIDFSSTFGDENVFNTFCEFLPDKDIAIIDDFSHKIYDNYLNFVLEKKNYEYNYCGTNYLQFMMRAVYVISGKDYINYGNMLKDITMEFERSLYSWNTKNISMYFTKLIFWVLALIYYNHDFSKLDLSYPISVFENEKYLDAFNKETESYSIDYKILVSFMKNPNSYIQIKLPFTYESCSIIEFNKAT
ncbi:hypothetical protein FACS189476_00060 [Spirochaetia bacterium]|nr:hypothetical protein FACS189476_00060 [Spirochaetia bacterium]